jgi:hypothetical protein
MHQEKWRGLELESVVDSRMQNVTCDEIHPDIGGSRDKRMNHSSKRRK